MKTQHNWVCRLLALTSLLFVCIVLFAACNSGDNQPAETDGTHDTCIESGWIVDKMPTHQEEGARHTECKVCKKILKQETLPMGSYGLSFSENDDGTYTVTGMGSCTDTDIMIPATYNGKAITSIGEKAFSLNIYGDSSLTSITIPDGVTSIGVEAFALSTGLTSITIPDSVTSIGDRAFHCCYSLKSITIPNSVTSIGDRAFYGCDSLTSITIPNSVTSIGNDAFRGCDSLDSITVDANNKTYHSMNNCLIKTDSKTLVVGCKNSVIPADGSVTIIGNGAFSGCSYLTSVTIPDSVTIIGNDAFSSCISLTSITIPNSVTRIGNSAFNDCYKLVEVYNLSALNIREYVNALHVYTPTSGESRLWTTDDGFIFYENGDICYLVGYTGTDTKITLPAACNGKNYEIYTYAFFPCTSLTSVTIPNSVTSIGRGAFDNCTSLTSVTIPNSITSICDYAFCGCSNLTSITIPDSVTSIGFYAFVDCASLTSVTIPDSVTSIGEWAFSGCTSLTSVNFEGTVAEWDVTSKYDGWNYSVPATEVVCSDGVVKLK